MLRILDFAAFNGHDHVAGLEPELGILIEIGDEDSLVRAEVGPETRVQLDQL